MLGACPPGMRPSGFVRFYGKQPPSRHKKPTASLAISGHQKIPLAPHLSNTIAVLDELSRLLPLVPQCIRVLAARTGQALPDQDASPYIWSGYKGVPNYS